MADVTDKDREAAKRFVYDYNVRDIFQSREGPIEDLTDIIARARAEGAASERGECDEAVQSVPTPPEWRDLLGDWRGQAFNAGLIAASDAIRARGEKGKD